MIEDGREVAFASLSIGGSPSLGEHVFTLRGASGQGLSWQGVSHHPDPDRPAAPEEALLQRLRADGAFVEEMRSRLHPGMLMVVTDLPVSPDRRTGTDFVVMADSDPHA